MCSCPSKSRLTNLSLRLSSLSLNPFLSIAFATVFYRNTNENLVILYYQEGCKPLPFNTTADIAKVKGIRVQVYLRPKFSENFRSPDLLSYIF